MGLGRRTFAPGEVLTASNVMNYLMDQTVMNFAGSAARGSAIGTAIQAGMVSTLNDSGRVEVYSGSTWNPLAYATAVPTLAQTGLRTVIPTGVTAGSGSGSFDSTTGVITFTTVGTFLNIAGIFTSAYRNYRILYSGSNSTASAVDFRYSSSATPSSVSYYQGTGRFAGNVFDNYSGTNINRHYMAINANSTANSMVASLDIFAPNVATFTGFTSIGSGFDGTWPITLSGGGQHQVSAQYDGIYFVVGAGTISGTIKVFGYN